MCSVCWPVLAARQERRARRHLQRRDLEHRAAPSRPMRLRASTRPARRRWRRRHVVFGGGAEELGGVRPERVERALHARVRLLGAVAEPHRPLGGVLQVIARFLQALGRDRRRARHRPTLRASATARAATRRRGSCAGSCARSRRSAARRSSGCGTAARCAGTRAGPRRGPCLPAAPACVSSRRACPIRSSATLVSAMSSSMIGPWPHHSDSRWPRISEVSAMRRRYSRWAALAAVVVLIAASTCG